MKKLIFSILFLLSITALAGCDKEAARTGDKAPDFNLNDINGKPLSLSMLRGKVILLEFWATWCPACKDAVPDLISFSMKQNQNDVVVVSISLDKDSAILKDFISAYKIPYAVALDNGSAKDAYLVSSIPSFFIIDKNGFLVKKFLGYAPGMTDTFSSDIKALI